MRRLLGLTLLPFLTVASADEIGRNIYLYGEDLQGQAIPVYLNGIPSSAALGCVQCHRESGLGTSESGQTIPPVSWRFLSTVQPPETARFENIRNRRNAYDHLSFHRMLSTGVNSNGIVADPLMPRYALSEEQSHHLINYLKTLYPGDDPGVDKDIVRIATIVDPRLDERARAQHSTFIKGLFAMKNAKTRGELKRKQFSPIQKVPQYESYRLWELEEWVLPEDPAAWEQALQQAYDRSPVFVILGYYLGDDSQKLSEFCAKNKIPCLFPVGDEPDGGDFYSFVFRDSQKQVKDFIAHQRRKHREHLFMADAKGNIRPVDKGLSTLPGIDERGLTRLAREYRRDCNEERVILVKANTQLAESLYDLACDNPGKSRLILVPDRSVSFIELQGLLDSKQNAEICWATDYSEVLRRDTREIRVSVLSRRFGIREPINEMLAKLLFGYGLLTDAMHQLAGTFSREYLLEIIEHMLNSFPNYTYFNTVSGAPYQRAIVGPYQEYCATRETES